MADQVSETGPMGQSVINARLMGVDETGKWVPLKLTEGGLATSAANGVTSVVGQDGITASISANVLTIEMTDMAQSTIKGRAESAGTGAPTDLTPAQVVAIIDAVDVTWTGMHSWNEELNLLQISAPINSPAPGYGQLYIDDSDYELHVYSNSSDRTILSKSSAASRLIGRGSAAGAGQLEEITLDDTLEMSTTALQRAALTGDVTAPSGSNTTTLASAVVGMANLTTAAKTSLQRKNLVINPQAAVNQRFGVASAVATDNAYGPDRWRLLIESANACNLATIVSTLTTSPYMFRASTGSSNNLKFGIFQIIEGIDCYYARGKTVTLSAQIRATSGISDMRMAIVNWTGTEDATSADPINVWGAAATVPTYTGSWANANTPANLSVTTSFAQYSVSATVSSSATNIGVFIWNEDRTTTGSGSDLFEVTDIQLEIGSTVTDLDYRSIGTEKALCSRFFQRLGGKASNEVLGMGQCYSTTRAFGGILIPEMRVAPTTSDVEGAAVMKVTNATGSGVNGTTFAVTTPATTRFSIDWDITVASGLVAGNACELLASATSYIDCSAEL